MRDTFTLCRLAVAVAFTLPRLVGAADLAPIGSGASETTRAAQGATAGFKAPVSETGRVTQYGPVKRGDTLTKIARIVKHDETTIEQTMVGLHRHNPHAFIRNNMNLLRTGQILDVPELFIMSSIPQRLAVREIQLQTADWESFQTRLAQREAPARTAEAPADARVKEMASIPSAAEQAQAAPVSAGVPAAEAAHQGAVDSTPHTTAASATSPSTPSLSELGYLAAGGGALALGGLAVWMRRRRTTAGSQRVAMRATAITRPVTPAAPPARSFASTEESNAAALAAAKTALAAIGSADASGATDVILVSAEAPAAASSSTSPIHNTLGGDGRNDRANVASASGGAPSDAAATAFIKADAAFDALLPFMNKATAVDPVTA